jgi:hypothetical protein
VLTGPRTWREMNDKKFASRAPVEHLVECHAWLHLAMPRKMSKRLEGASGDKKSGIVLGVRCEFMTPTMN